MIRFAEKSDIQGIISIWNEAFGDSENDILFFLNSRFIPENTLVYECDGVIASILFLLEGDMHINEMNYPSYYLYAACTLKSHRGRGYMAELLDASKKVAAERDKHFICLLPGNKTLYGFYAKFGYKSVFPKKHYVFGRDEFDNHACPLTHNTQINFAQIRDCFLSGNDYFRWNESAVEFAFEHNKHHGGKEITNCKGYILYSVDGDVCSVKENTFPAEILPDYISKIFSDNPECKTVDLYTPVIYELPCKEYEIIDSGMLLSIDNSVKITENAYLGLTLD